MRISTSLSCLFSLLLAVPTFLAAEEVPAGATYSIDSVGLEGNKRIDTEALRVQLKKTSGTITEREISEDVKNLYITGFFEDVSAKVIKVGQKSVLKYTLLERPSVRKVFIKGNKEVSEKDLSTVLDLDAKRFFDRNKVSALVRNGISYYQTRGFFDATLTYSVVPAGDNQVDLTFEVVEGPKFKILKVQFKGLAQIPEDDLAEVMQTKRYKWWSSWILGTGRLNKEMLENDKNLIRQYFLDHGFLEATVSDASIEKEEEARLVISFDVSEGRQYHIGTLSLKGDVLPSGSAETLKDLASKTGEVFSASSLRKDSFTVTDKFADIGYAFANVVPYTDVDHDTGVVNVQFEVTKGEIATINTIGIHGNQKTYDHVIRRELKVQEQEQFAGTKIKRSRELLQRLGYFQEVTITPQPVQNVPNKVDLDVNVKEASTGAFSIGAGYSTSDGALFNTKLSENNLFGTGKRAEASVDVGTQRNNVILSLEDPRFNDSHVSLGTDLYYTQRDFTDFSRELEGVGVTAGYPLDEWFGDAWEDYAASLKYEYQGIKISNVTSANAAPLVIASEGSTTSSAFTPRIQRNTINNPLNPTDGSRQSLSLELAGFGGDEKYYLFEAKNTTYYPLLDKDSGDLTFSYRAVLGVGETYNGDPFPLFKRYFPGGINSIRGYKSRGLGPKDINGNAYGGSKEFVNNFELIFPLISSAGIRGVVFYDVGQAFDDGRNIQIQDLRQAYGTGIRWMSPIGPLRVEVGFPVSRKQDEKAVVPMFSFGAPF